MQIEANNYTIAVLGSGTMGQGIAQIAGTAGHPVLLYDVSQEQTQSAIENIAVRLKRSVNKEKITDKKRTQILANIKPVQTFEELAKAKLAIEAIIEDLLIKQDVFSQLELLLEEDAILATNTSSIDLNEMGRVLKRPERLVGMHFFNPAPVMSLVEIIRALQTSDETFATTKAIALQLGKTPVEVTDSPGFVVNRMLVPMINEAIFVYSEGVATVDDIDAAMKLGANHPMGPLALADLIGLDICLSVMEVLYQEFSDSKYRPCPLLKKMVAAGYLGRKSGRGFHSYA